MTNLYAGIDIGGTSTKWMIVNSSGQIVADGHYDSQGNIVTKVEALAADLVSDIRTSRVSELFARVSSMKNPAPLCMPPILSLPVCPSQMPLHTPRSGQRFLDTTGGQRGLPKLSLAQVGELHPSS